MKLEKAFYTGIFTKNFGDSNKELNQRLIRDIDHEMSISKSVERSFAHNECAWASDTKMNKRYDSFKELGNLIKESSQLSMITAWANVIFKPGGFSIPHTHGKTNMLNIKSFERPNYTGVYFPQSLYDEYDDQVISSTWNQDEGLLVLFDKASINKVRTVKPRESLLILFPVTQPHMVAPMVSNRKRYSISFQLYNKINT